MTKFRVGAAAILVGHGCAAPAASPPPPSLEIPRLPRDPGQIQGAGARFVHEPARSGSSFHVSVHAASHVPDPSGGEQESEYESELDGAVLEVEAGAPARVRVRFERNANLYQGILTPTPIDGRTYVASVRDPHVTDDSGGVPTPAEVERVLDVFPDLGTRSKLEESLPDGPIVVGERRDDLARAVLRILHPRAWTFDDGAATLARIDGGEAVFDVRIDAHSAQSTILTVGEVRVRLRPAGLASIVLRGTYPPNGKLEYRRVVTDR
ncbi:MAG TPA: hypothetical protein VIF62_26955 [Labilithrix sp.]